MHATGLQQGAQRGVHIVLGGLHQQVNQMRGAGLVGQQGADAVDQNFTLGQLRGQLGPAVEVDQTNGQTAVELVRCGGRLRGAVVGRGSEAHGGSWGEGARWRLQWWSAASVFFCKFLFCSKHCLSGTADTQGRKDARMGVGMRWCVSARGATGWAAGGG